MYALRCQMLLRNLLLINNNNILGSNESRFSTSSIHYEANTNYYEALGIAKGSTQQDIKAAYYRLSKEYHPDKNQGCETSAKKFRQITQAYEVLGNYRLRRLYDKGVMPTAGTQFGQKTDIPDDIEPEVEDDPQTKFYKSRFRKSKVVDMSGRTPIYDFDEWSRMHYGKAFDRRHEAKQRHDRNEMRKRDNILSSQNEILIFGLLFTLIVTYMCFVDRTTHDTPIEAKSTVKKES